MPDNEVGFQRGLAYRNDVSGMIGDYERHDLRQKQNKELATAKANLFADSLQYQNASNSFDNQRIKAINDAKIREIGAYYKENPDALYNKDKLIFVQQMRRELLDNEDVLRGKASDDNFKALNADLQEISKNPNQHNQLAYQNLLAQKENYLKYGNQLGIEASQKDGYKPFVYQKPADFIDLSKKGSDLGNNFKDVKPVQLKNGRSGAWETVANEGSLNKDAQAFYLEHKEQFDQQHPNNGLGVAKELIRSGIQYKFDWGNTNLADDLAKIRYNQGLELEKIKAKNAKGAGMSAYVETILKPSRTATNPEFLDKTFGSKIKHKIVNDDSSVQIDNTGDVFNYNGDIQDQNYRSDGKYQPNGVKRVSGFVYKPIEWAIENKIVNEGWFSDPKVDGNWANTASIVDSPSDKDGKVQKLVKFKVSADLKGNDASYQGKYDSNIETTDLRNAFGIKENMMESETLVDDAGNLFDKNGKYLGKAK